MFNRALTLTRHLVPTAAQGPDMEFEWDEDKRLKVLEKHGKARDRFLARD